MQIAKAGTGIGIGDGDGDGDDAPRGDAEFDQGAGKKYVIDPHGATSRAS